MMLKTPVSIKTIVVYLLLFSGLFVAAIVCDANIALVIALSIWLVFYLYIISNIKHNIVIFCFLSSFFVFLLGREVCFTFFGLKRYYLYLEEFNDFSFNLISISLVSLFLGLKIAEHLDRKKHLSSTNISNSPEKNRNIKVCQQITKVVFFVCLFASYITTVLQIRFVGVNGYMAGYVEGMTDATGALSYIAAFMITSLGFYLATCPSKRDSVIALFTFEIYGVLTLFTGHRYMFIAVSMLVLSYAFIREKNGEKWVKRRYILYILAVLPFLFIGMAAMDALRNGDVADISNFWKSIRDFFDQQGGSINVIKRIKYYKNDLSDMYFLSFSGLRSVFLENGIVRRLFNVTVYTGNSVANALNGHSLAHRLSYYEYGNYYLMGHGTGSCYIAELFHDFSYIGVIFGNIFYGYIMKKMSEISFDNYFIDGVLLSFFYGLILAPRGSFDRFLSDVFSLYSLAGMFMIFLGINIFSRRKK